MRREIAAKLTKRMEKSLSILRPKVKRREFKYNLKPQNVSHATPHFWRELQIAPIKRDQSTSRGSAASRPNKARSARQEVDL